MKFEMIISSTKANADEFIIIHFGFSFICIFQTNPKQKKKKKKRRKKMCRQIGKEKKTKKKIVLREICY